MEDLPIPRYFFDMDDGTKLFIDDQGTELADDHAARLEGTAALAAMGKDHMPGESSEKRMTMLVRKQEGEPFLELALTFKARQLGP